MRSSLWTEKGFTLVELLATLTLVGIISVIIASYFSTGLNSFRKVNEEISLHDDANYVMGMFENEILEAITVIEKDSEPKDFLYEITKMDGDQVTFGFKNKQAVINYNPSELNDTPLHTSRVEITDESGIEIDDEKNHVTIKMKMKMKDSSENMVTLENRIPYIKVEGGAESETGNGE